MVRAQSVINKPMSWTSNGYGAQSPDARPLGRSCLGVALSKNGLERIYSIRGKTRDSSSGFLGGPLETRTPDPLIKSQRLAPTADLY